MATLSSSPITIPRKLVPRKRWDSAIPPILQPLVRAYLLGYASAVGPRLLTLLLQRVARSRHKNKKPGNTARATQQPESFSGEVQRILRGAVHWQRLPTFCAALVGGTTLLELPLRAVLARYAESLPDIARRRLARWFASFIAAWLSLRLLQSKQTPSFTDVSAEPGPDGRAKTVRYAGRTLDLTFMAVTGAVDVIGGELWHRRAARRQAAGKWTRLDALIARLTDPAIFALSSGLIMWTWIYHPSRLPRAYNKWIASAAAVDDRLIAALQRCRDRTLLYGRDTGHAPLLGAMCADYGWPRAWGDPAESIPFPCEIVHMGSGPSCERHALSRFARSFRWALASYLPLTLLLTLRSGTLPTPKSLRRALTSASRSSAFLGAFIALFYYGVCLARTRLGPRILGCNPSAAQRIDGGVCVGAGCVLCGWSIVLEASGRRKDMALFVAPRALATLFPRRYALDKQWRERIAFAASAAVVLTCFAEERRRVRGVLGGVLGSVFRE